MAVFVIDKKGKPLMPCSEKRARLLLGRKRAVVHKMYPFTIRIKDLEGGNLQDMKLKIDPGSKFTGVAIVHGNNEVKNLFQVNHRGTAIKLNLLSRRALRRGRRARSTRYRPPRWKNRTRKEGWLPPSLQHRVDTTGSWINRIMEICPITEIAVERVKFDMQLMQNPEISGVEYQQGTLAGYSVREYLLEKWGRKCAYCGVENTPLQIEHLKAKAKGGGNRITNLALACEPCNKKKGVKDIADFLKHKPDVLKRVMAQAKKPLHDAAAVNATRNSLFITTLKSGLPVEGGHGAQTKFNRVRLGIPKDHPLDAACVGVVTELKNWDMPVLHINCTGRGSYQRARTDRFGFPGSHCMRQKAVHGFQTGDMVSASVKSGKKTGEYIGRVAIRKTGSFNITTKNGVIQGICHKNCKLIQRGDGYGYALKQLNITQGKTND
jgi:5-methylcytosine-specific restriction endonuclease McrA